MEIIDYIALCILAWGGLGAICLLSIGIRKDIQSYFERKRCPICQKKEGFFRISDFCDYHLNKELL